MESLLCLWPGLLDGEVAPGGLVLGYFDAAYIDHSIDLRWLMLSSAKVRPLVSRFSNKQHTVVNLVFNKLRSDMICLKFTLSFTVQRFTDRVNGTGEL